MYTLGIDIGASKVVAALMKNARIIRYVKIAYARKKAEDAEAAIFAAADSAIGNSKISGIGLGVPCALDKNKRVLACANIDVLRPGIIAKTLGKTYHAPVIIENDVKAAAVAELKWGIGRKSKNFIFIAFGTGIGGAIIIDGKPYRGHLGWAGEFGHTIVKIQNLKFSAKGGSAAGGKIQNSWTEWEDIASAQFLRAGGKRNELAKNIALGLLNITYALAPEYIIIGGGLLSLWSEKFDAEVISTMKRMRFSSKLPLPKIVRSRFGENAGAIGAALLPSVAKRQQMIYEYPDPRGVDFRKNAE